jgi:DNA-binding NtrC family response regulator
MLTKSALEQISAANILVVEDDEDLKIIVERIFKSISPHITHTWVTTAEKAVTELRTEHYDLVFSDFYLRGNGTGLDLWEFCQDRFPDLPFVMTSGIELQRFFKLVGKKRASPMFLPKPFYAGECKQLIGSFLEPRESRLAG